MSKQILHFDCFSGASGDMILGALLAVGGSEARLREGLNGLSVEGWQLDILLTSKNYIGATDVTVTLLEQTGHGRHLHHIVEILENSKLPPTVIERAKRIFQRLAEAEAKVHQTTIESIHFHEVGAVDAIVDIVGSCLLLEDLGIERITSSPLPMSRGFVRCMHGVIPIPVPAVMELVNGYPIVSIDVEGELVTPTGAAILTTLVDEWGPIPAMTPVATGYGAGKSDFGERPNLLRAILGHTGSAEHLNVSVIETNLDDMNPQFVPPMIEALLAAGALDAYTTPVNMKKGRPAFLLTVIAPPEFEEALCKVIFEQSPTLGVRIHESRRKCLDRFHRVVTTEYGDIRIKVGIDGDQALTASPEFEDVLARSRETGVAVRAIHSAAIVADTRSTKIGVTPTQRTSNAISGST